MARVRDGLTKGWERFRRLPLFAQGVFWAVLGVVAALLVLSLESEPVENAGGPLVATPGPQTTVGTTDRPGNRDLPEDPRKKDPQLSAGDVPAEIGDYQVPRGFRATTEQVTKLFQETLGGRGRAGLNRNQLVDVRCSNGDCRIEYIPDGPGAGRIIEAQAVLWLSLLEDPGWTKATMVVRPGGPDILGPDGRRKEDAPPETGGPPLVEITCGRDDVEAIGADWGVQAGPAIRNRCDIGDIDQPGR